jgi:hypothetical protein
MIPMPVKVAAQVFMAGWGVLAFLYYRQNPYG